MTLVMLKSTLVILTAACAAVLLRRESASLRHFVWAAGLVGALAVPLSSLVLPGLELPVSVPPTPWTEQAGGQLVLGVWLAGAALGVLALLVAAAHLGWYAFRACPMQDPRWDSILPEIAGKLGLRSPVRLLQTDAVAFIGTWGIFRPSVLLPAGAETWPEDRIRIVLAHELAHARRRDWTLQVLAETSRAIYWFNPLFWLAAHRLRVESEHAADDAVLGLGVDGADYADALVRFSRELGRSGGSWLPVLGMAHRSPLETRLRAVLNPSIARLAATPWAILLVVLVAVGLTLPLAALRSSRPSGAAVGAPSEAGAVSESIPVPEPVASAEPGAPVPAEIDTGESCEVTPSVRETPPPDRPELAAIGAGPWFVNPERTIWIWDQPWVAETRTSLVAVRPQGTRLSASGRKTDGSAVVPLDGAMTRSGLLAFKTGGFLFPSAGCWEVTARAGDQVLTFVTRVGT